MYTIIETKDYNGTKEISTVLNKWIFDDEDQKYVWWPHNYTSAIKKNEDSNHTWKIYECRIFKSNIGEFILYIIE